MEYDNTEQIDIEIAQKTIRTFSWKAYAENPDDSLTESLVTAGESIDLNHEPGITLREQWMQLFDPASKKALNGGKEDAILADPTEELAKVYQKFLKCLPKDHAARIEDGPPDLRVVVEALTVAELNWKNNREKTRAGRMKALFGKLSINATKFKDVFAVIPSGDKYVCLLTGSISAIVKATVNHEKIAESVSAALDDLSDDIAYWKDLLEAKQDTKRLEHYVARLYVVIFKFLASIMMKWSSKSTITRMFRSFDSEFFKEEIDNKKNSIQELERKLARQAELEWHRQLSQSIEVNTTTVQEMAAAFQDHLVVQLNKQQKILGQSTKDLLQQQLLNLQQMQNFAKPERSSSNLMDQDPGQRASGAAAAGMVRYSAEQVRLPALHLLRSYVVQQQNIPLLVARSKMLSIHREAFQRIQLWNATSASPRLWILGPYQAPKPSSYTHLSAHVVLTAQEAGVPVIFYFGDTKGRVIDLVYTLIVQITEQAPQVFDSHLEFSTARFEAALTGKDDSLGRATQLLQDLISIAKTRMLLIVIDGVRMLDRSAETRAQLKDIVAALTASMNAFATREEAPGTSIMGGAGDQALKILFTTDGFTDALVGLKGGERTNHMDFAGEDDEADGVLVKLTMRQ